MDFLKQQANLALGSHLKRLSDQLITQVAQLYQEHQIPLNPACFPLFSLLLEQGALTTTDAARLLGVSHVAIGKTARQLIDQALITKERSTTDERRYLLTVTAQGQQVASQAAPVWQGIRSALAEVDAGQEAPLLKALCDFEQQIAQTSLVERVNRHIHQPEQLQIIDWDPRFRDDFRQLNEQWLNRYFADQWEPSDHQALQQPEQYFLSQGGYIWLAQIGEQIVGCCALKADGENFELCKMGVHPDWQGQGIGRRLLLHVLTRLRNLHCPKIWLDTSSKLERAMALYLHFGFQPVLQSYQSLYRRADTRLQLTLSEAL